MDFTFYTGYKCYPQIHLKFTLAKNACFNIKQRRSKVQI